MRALSITLRCLARRPTYALLATATLVLGVCAVTAGYGLLHQVVLRALPFHETERLVAIRTLYDRDLLGLTRAEYLEVAEHAGAFESVAALVEPELDADWILEVGGDRTPLDAVRVTEGFFRTLGVAPELGTLAGEGSPREGRALVSRDFWRTELGGDPGAVGRTLRINGEPYVVVAVLPSSFELPLGPEPTDVWLPFAPEPVEAYAGMPLAYRAIGRLAPGVAAEGASAEVGRLVDGVRSALGDAPGRTMVRSLEEDLVGSARRPLALLTLSGALVLLVASLNLSMLVAARNVERREELAVRTALGATRGHLLRHVLLEAGVLALAAGGFAVLLAGVLLERISESPIVGLERLSGAGLAPRVVLVGLAAAAVPALLAAALPALRIADRGGPSSARGSSSDHGGARFAWLLSAVESGAVFALLVVAVLAVRSLQEVTAVDPGFDAHSTLAVRVFLPLGPSAPDEAVRSPDLLTRLEERLVALPGVRAAGSISNLPLGPESWSGGLEVEGRDDIVGEEPLVVDWELVSPGYFDAMAIPVLRGRRLDAGDREGSPPVVVVNETLARRWGPGGEVIGARISGGGPLRTVVGVVGDVKQQGLHTGTRGFMYLPALQTGAPARQEVVVRVEGDDPGAYGPAVRAALLELEPDLAIGPVRTLDALVADSSGSFRLRAVLLGGFAILTLLLGMAGIYGVTAHGVRARRRDIGIRMALGADGRRILAGVVGRALLPVVAGLLVGLFVVLLGAPALRALLFGVEPTDPGFLLGVAAFLLAGGVGAVLPSAVRARRMDPAGMLRID